MSAPILATSASATGQPQSRGRGAAAWPLSSRMSRRGSEMRRAGIAGLVCPTATSGAIALTSGGRAERTIAMATTQWPARVRFGSAPRVLELARSGSLMKSGPTPAFVLARVCAPAAQARLPVSAGSSVESTRRWSRGCRCRGPAAASPRVPRGRRSSSLTRGMVSEHGGARWGGCRVAGVHLVLGEERVSTSLGRSQRSPQLGETRRRCGVSGGGLGCRAGG